LNHLPVLAQGSAFVGVRVMNKRYAAGAYSSLLRREGIPRAAVEDEVPREGRANLATSGYP